MHTLHFLSRPIHATQSRNTSLLSTARHNKYETNKLDCGGKVTTFKRTAFGVERFDKTKTPQSILLNPLDSTPHLQQTRFADQIRSTQQDGRQAPQWGLYARRLRRTSREHQRRKGHCFHGTGQSRNTIRRWR